MLIFILPSFLNLPAIFDDRDNFAYFFILTYVAGAH